MIEGEGSPNGNSEPLTVTSAAAQFSGLLSDFAETPESKTQKKPVESAAEEEVSEEEPTEGTESEGEAEPTEDDEHDENVDESEEEAEEETPKPRVHRIKIDGKDEDVEEEELKKGYSRTADYTRKSMALAEERRKFEGEEVVAVQQERRVYADRIARMEELLKTHAVKEPDWDTMRVENPEAFAVEWAAHQQQKARLDAVANERVRAEALVAEENGKAFEKHVEGERAKVFEVLPQWKDAKVAKKEVAEMRDYARTLGYTDQEISSVYDHRVLKMLHMAMSFEKSKAKAPAIKNEIDRVTKLSKPGSGSKKAVNLQATRTARVRETGRLEDAAAAISGLL